MRVGAMLVTVVWLLNYKSNALHYSDTDKSNIITVTRYTQLCTWAIINSPYLYYNWGVKLHWNDTGFIFFPDTLGRASAWRHRSGAHSIEIQRQR